MTRPREGTAQMPTTRPAARQTGRKIPLEVTTDRCTPTNGSRDAQPCKMGSNGPSSRPAAGRGVDERLAGRGNAVGVEARPQLVPGQRAVGVEPVDDRRDAPLLVAGSDPELAEAPLYAG